MIHSYELSNMFRNLFNKFLFFSYADLIHSGHMQHVKLGKHPPVFDKRTLKLSFYLKAKLAPPPPTVNWAKPISSWGMMKNDIYGNCTCAAAGHMIMEWTANNGNEVVIPDKTILEFYNHFTHGEPDTGASMLAVLKFWRKKGLASHKIQAFAALEPHNNREVQNAVNIFGNCYIGLSLPNSVVFPKKDRIRNPWIVPSQGPIGDAAPNKNNGHCVPAVGYDQHNLYVVTWGIVKPMSWQFYDIYMDEAYAVLSPDWFNNKTHQTPEGFDITTLMQDLQKIDLS